MHFVVVFGPPAVGKMTVGRELASRTSYRLLHNHLTIEPLLEVFDFDSQAFGVLNQEFRRRIVEEAIRSDLPGLIFTAVWALDDPQDTAYAAGLIEPVVASGGRVDFVELRADLPTRLEREGGNDRIAAKPSKRDHEFARGIILN